jgi:hypothetical protein
MRRSEGSAGVGRQVHVGLGHVCIYGIESVWRGLDNDANWRKRKDCGRKRTGDIAKKDKCTEKCKKKTNNSRDAMHVKA